MHNSYDELTNILQDGALAQTQILIKDYQSSSRKLTFVWLLLPSKCGETMVDELHYMILEVQVSLL